MSIAHVDGCICERRVDEFRCSVCDLVVGWCKGGEGDEDICDDCWAKRHQHRDEQSAPDPEPDQHDAA